ncbi:hypothetical protein BCV69DRAFT_285391 [Microstroma glucosiphilum]|uniref:Uncharacterized protein n=1 Tax=Pseudomicrostroma glucosiphilum TaxID=1684307 RepID=A0A316TYF2_9BASI|nr:hypothetical protein BCV69DRAFT_285391 [Pseudomicrostroma glucosiphilum]PWN18090.1 hypothetical protein BCV69DRAFT_285391 [Pseudomicrostroma glucosiphilum]
MSLQTDGLDDRAGRILVLSTGDLPLASLEQLVHSITGRSHREGTEGQVRLSDVVHYDEDGDEDEDGASSFVTTRPVPPPTSSTDAASTSQIPWTIDNTYYTADVHFRLVSLPSSSSSSAPSRGATAQAKRREREEELQTILKEETKDVTAIVLVVRGGQTLKEHERVLDALQQCATEQRISQEDAEDANLSQSAATPSLGAESSTAQAEAEMPMGFGLAVSTVISLPSIVDAHNSRTFQGKPASRDGLLDLYAQNGWEYIDLGADTDSGVSGMGTTSASTALLDDSASEGSEERAGDAPSLSESEDDEEADDEAVGLERVKEALEANMWPGLVRKDRSGGTASQARAGNLADGWASSSSMTTSALPQDRLAALSQILDANESIEQDGAELDAGLDAELDSLFRRLDLNLPSGSLLPPTSPSAGLDTGLGLGAHAEPTAQDEELARRFLASIADFEKYQFAEEVGIGEKQEGEPGARKGLQGDREAGGKTLPESEEERNRNQAEALRKLEEWLQNEDGDWLGASTSTSKRGLDFGDSDPDFAGQADTQGKDNKVRLPPRAAGDTFDDDFDEFISASASASANGGEGGGANAGPASFGFDEELSRHPHYKPAVDARTQSEGKSQSKDHGLGGVGGGDSDSDVDGDGPASTAFNWPEAQAGDLSLGDQGREMGSVPTEEVREDAVEPSSLSTQGPFHSFPASVEFGERIDADADDLVVEQ